MLLWIQHLCRHTYKNVIGTATSTAPAAKGRAVGVGVYHIIQADGKGFLLRAGMDHSREAEVHPGGNKLDSHEDKNRLNQRQDDLPEDARFEAPSSRAASSRLRGY